MRPRIVFVDVDDTLIRSVRTKRIPMPVSAWRFCTHLYPGQSEEA